MRWFIPITLALLLAGCGFTATGDAVRGFAVTKGKEAYAEGLANAEWFVCRAASVGSVQDRYGRSANLAEAWRSLCLPDRNNSPVPFLR